MNAWLVRVALDLRDRDVRRDYGDAVRMHQRVMTLVPGSLGERARQQTGLLYRTDETRTGPQLLIQTNTKPDLARLPGSYGQAEVRELGPLLKAFEPGQRLAYRLAANTTKRLGRHAGRDEGKIVPLTGDDIDQWWLTRAPRSGLALQGLRSQPQSAATGERGGTGRLRHTITRFDGAATVTDAEALRTAILTGVGRGKSYGCGLLSVAILRNHP